MKVAIAQIAPVFLDRQRTLEKVSSWIEKAAKAECRLVAFSETLVPGYPIWLDRTGGARFNDDQQKEIHALYLDQSVDLAGGDLQGICQLANDHNMFVVIGIAERARDRSGYTIYCSAVVIGDSAEILSVHRKLMPTYEERLAWGIGDGAGLVVHPVDDFHLGALNCWENWMPLARAALQGQGEDLHVALWPGQLRNTIDITPFMAIEGRSYVMSSSGLLRASDIPVETPLRSAMVNSEDEIILCGGSVIVGPDGKLLRPALVDHEDLICAHLDTQRVRAERQNFDPHGHYGRPDVLKLVVDRRRQRTVEFEDD